LPKRNYGFEKMTIKLSCRVLIALALIASTSLLLPQSSQACGPFFSDTIFVYTKHPDFPLERFAKGQLGVLRPSYARSYLFAAYRNLTNAAFSDAEQAALKSLWEDRLNNSWDSNDDAWIIACDLWPGSNSDYAIRHWNGSCWEKTPGAADQVAVDYDGTAWVINSLGDLYFYGGGAYHQVPGSYTSITRGTALPASGGKIAPWAPFGELVIGNVPGDVVQLAATTSGSSTSPEVGALFAMDLGGFIYQYEGVNAVSFQNQTAAGDSSYDFDWDICRGKRTCPAGQGLIGLSVGLGAGGAGHSAICLPDWGFDGIPSATLTVDDGVDQRRYDHTGGDWSPGYLKLECGKGEYVSGVSEDALSCPPSPEDNAFHAIQCSQPLDPDSFGSALCTARSVDSQGSSDGDFLTGVDWDPWFVKRACSATEFVAGISVDLWTHKPHALLCCARE